ncbi:hypothetical protein ABPG75_010109 [Micractinium tetrahymenae]
MAEGHNSPAAMLPPDLLCRIFDVAEPSWLVPFGQPSPTPLLSFAERVQAEAVSRHWQAALRSRPGSYPILELGNPGGTAASEQWAAQEARVVAARAPVVHKILLTVRSSDSPQLTARLSAALEGLLAHSGTRRGVLDVHGRCQPQLLAALAAAARHASLARLELRCFAPSGGLRLAASAVLPSLPHLRLLHIRPPKEAKPVVRLALPMPQLEACTVQAYDSDHGLIPPRPVFLRADGGSGSPPAGPLFPALTRLDLMTAGLALDGSALPALAQLRLLLFFPRAQLTASNLPALSRITRMDLAGTRLAGGVLQDSEVGVAPYLYRQLDMAVHSNRFASLLAGTARTLRQLSLTLEEPLNAAMAAALRGLAQLTQHRLRIREPEDAA